jgi:amidophosphoribosyltransferase
MGRGNDGTIMLASESVALEGTTISSSDIAPGEAILCTTTAASEPAMR